jgi:hypothetical protein
MKLLNSLILFSLLVFSTNHAIAQNCKDIRTTTDSRTGNIKHESPLYLDMSYIKEVVKTDTFYYLYIQVLSPDVRSNQKGCKLLLSDSSYLEFPEQYIGVDKMLSYGGRYVHKYSAKIQLSASDIAKLSSNDIEEFWVYIQASTVGKLLKEKKNKKTFRTYLNCLRIK